MQSQVEVKWESWFMPPTNRSVSELWGKHVEFMDGSAALHDSSFKVFIWEAITENWMENGQWLAVVFNCGG